MTYAFSKSAYQERSNKAVLSTKQPKGMPLMWLHSKAGEAAMRYLVRGELSQSLSWLLPHGPQMQRISSLRLLQSHEQRSLSAFPYHSMENLPLWLCTHTFRLHPNSKKFQIVRGFRAMYSSHEFLFFFRACWPQFHSLHHSPANSNISHLPSSAELHHFWRLVLH